MVKQTYCKRNHEFTVENTYVTKSGLRHCKACRRETMRLRREGTQVGYANARKTHCPKGHEYTEDNTIHSVTSKGTPRRWCKACAKAHHAKLRVKKYGLTEEQYASMLLTQENSCGICARKFA